MSYHTNTQTESKTKIKKNVCPAYGAIFEGWRAPPSTIQGRLASEWALRSEACGHRRPARRLPADRHLATSPRGTLRPSMFPYLGSVTCPARAQPDTRARQAIRRRAARASQLLRTFRLPFKNLSYFRFLSLTHLRSHLSLYAWIPSRTRERRI